MARPVYPLKPGLRRWSKVYVHNGIVNGRVNWVGPYRFDRLPEWANVISWKLRGRWVWAPLTETHAFYLEQ